MLMQGHSGVPSNQRAAKLAGEAAERQAPHSASFAGAPQIQDLEQFQKAKGAMACNGCQPRPNRDSSPPPKISVFDWGRNSVARAAAKTLSGHRCSAVYLKMVQKCTDDKCWFSKNSVQMTRLHFLLHGRNDEAGGCEIGSAGGEKQGWCPGAVGQSQLGQEACSFLSAVWVGRMMADGTVENRGSES
jgi:hypothetical protein